MGAIFDGFKYQDHILCSDGIRLEEIADKVGTPAYIYLSSLMTRAYQDLDVALKDIPHLICYAVKANPNLAVIKTFAQLGSGADIVSGGELFRALDSEIPSDKIIFSGVGKTKEEIEVAIRKKILCFNIESEQELITVDLIAKSFKRIVDVTLRINPDVDPKTHPYIATGLRKSKFGIPYRKALDLVRSALRLKNVRLVGLSCHIGSQITQTKPFEDSLNRMLKLFDQISKLKHELLYLNMGGGLGVTYSHEKPPSLSDWAQSFLSEIKDRKFKLILEPGRSLVANAGVLLTKVLYVKRGESNNFIIVDAGMNDLVRPALYDAFHSILPVKYKRYKKIKASVVGPCCESGDKLTNERRIQNFQPGDLLAVMSAGAYGSSMSSHYNSRTKIPEVIIHDQKFYTIRERETYEDLIAKEKLPPYLKRSVAATA